MQPARRRTSTPTSCEISRDAALLGGVSRVASRDPKPRPENVSAVRENPGHPSLHFKKVHDRDPIYSARVTLGYRAVGLLEDDEITWFWIGTHAGYDRLLDQL